MTTAEIITTQQVVITETAVNVLEVEAPTAPATVEIVIAGPQGATGQSGVTNLYELSDVDVSSKTDKSVLSFDAGVNKWTGNDVNTLMTLTDGGSF